MVFYLFLIGIDTPNIKLIDDALNHLTQCYRILEPSMKSIKQFKSKLMAVVCSPCYNCPIDFKLSEIVPLAV